MKFVADRMLGRLAKRLRLLGYDTIFQTDVADDALVTLIRGHADRVLLTRHRAIMKRVPPERSLFVTKDHPDAQLRQVLKQLRLKPDRRAFFTRCSLCNGSLQHVGPDVVAGQVPEYVGQTQGDFSICKSCGKIYWQGTHAARFRDHLEVWLRNDSEDTTGCSPSGGGQQGEKTFE